MSLTARPLLPAITPQHSLGASRRACATISCTIACGSTSGSGRSTALPPDLAVDILGQVAVVRGPERGREVLPAAVRQNGDDPAAFAVAHLLGGHAFSR